jgi:hypothetical protein
MRGWRSCSFRVAEFAAKAPSFMVSNACGEPGLPEIGLTPAPVIENPLIPSDHPGTPSLLIGFQEWRLKPPAPWGYLFGDGPGFAIASNFERSSSSLQPSCWPRTRMRFLRRAGCDPTATMAKRAEHVGGVPSAQARLGPPSASAYRVCGFADPRAGFCAHTAPPLNDGLSTTADKTGIGSARWPAPGVLGFGSRLGGQPRPIE